MSGKMADESPKMAKKGPTAKSNRKSENSVKNKQVEAAIRAQVAAEEKAHRIVEKLVLQGNVEENYFLEIGNYITTSHYLDITEERALAKVCGYPLCSNPMSKILQQKYKISVQTNRVFDISERKHFCSNQCYKASKYYESQIPTSPVWSRTNNEIKTFMLLKKSDPSTRAGGGEVMVGSLRSQDDSSVLDHIEETTDGTKYDLTDSFESQSEDGSLQAAESGKTPESEVSGRSNYVTKKTKSTITNHELEQLHNQNICKNNDSMENVIRDSSNDDLSQCSSKTSNDSNTEIGTDKKGFQIYNQAKCKADEVSTKDIFVKCITETLRDWFTAATYQYLKVENRSPDVEVLEASDTLPSFTERALNFLKLDERSHDSEDDDDVSSDDNKIKYILKTESQITSEEITITEHEYPNKGFACIVPPIDSKSQVTMRRQIVLQKMTHLLPEMIEPSQFSIREMENHFSKLVKTFRLNSQNVMFKPIEWRGLVATLLCLICQNLNVEVVGCTSDIKETMTKTISHIGLTHQDMINITNSLTTRKIADSDSCKLTQNKSEDGQTESYSQMEDLD